MCVCFHVCVCVSVNLCVVTFHICMFAQHVGFSSLCDWMPDKVFVQLQIHDVCDSQPCGGVRQNKGRQADEQTVKQTSRTDRKDRHTDTQTDKTGTHQTDTRSADRHTDSQADRLKDRQGKKAGRQGQADRKMICRQTDRQTHFRQTAATLP